FSSALFDTDGESEGAKRQRFYWLDAYVDDQRQPGVVRLFGKTFDSDGKQLVSTCVTVNNVERIVYLYPRQKRTDVKTGRGLSEHDVALKDVYEEFKEIALQHKIGIFRSKRVFKRYAFEHDDVSRNESEYLQVWNSFFSLLYTLMVS